MRRPHKLGFIGSGNMGQALVRGVVARGGFDPGDVMVSDLKADRVASLAAELGVAAAGDNAALVDGSRIVILAVKPQVLRATLAPIADRFDTDHLVISIAAGISASTLARWLPAGVPIVRAMPNTPSLVGAGATGISVGPAATANHAEEAARIFGAVGLARVLPEAQIDALTAVSGCGPAYVFHMLEAMIEAGVALGLGRALASDLAIQTVAGAATLAGAADVDPGELRRRVMSPGGVTERAIAALDAHGFQPALIAALTAARDRSVEMAAAVDG